MSSNEQGPIRKKGLKIDNQNSSVPPPKPNTAAIFDEKAKEVYQKYEEYKQRTWDLSIKFKSMIEDKMLTDNRSVLSRGIESETLNKLVALASEMNEDDNQPEGIGSTALAMLLMKMMLIQRDTINSLLFKVDKLEKNISKVDSLKSSEIDKK